MGLECHRQGREVRKYEETDYHVVVFGLLMEFVDNKKTV